MGFRKSSIYKLLDAAGDIRIETDLFNEENGEGVKSQSLIKLDSKEIEEGMSGAGVLDLETKRIIGIVSLHHASPKTDVDKGLNFAIPVSSILKAAPILENSNWGLNPTREEPKPPIGIPKERCIEKIIAIKCGDITKYKSDLIVLHIHLSYSTLKIHLSYSKNFKKKDYLKASYVQNLANIVI